jgi:hypothetical protein
MNSSMNNLNNSKPLYKIWIGGNKFYNSGSIYAG